MYQTELKCLIHNLNNKNSSADVILLCETFLNKKIENLVNILGYNLVGNNHQHSKCGGTAILIKEQITFNR